MTERGIILVFVVTIGFARIFGVTNDFYKDASHIFVGVLIGLAYRDWSKSKDYAYMALGISLLELAVFLFRFFVLKIPLGG